MLTRAAYTTYVAVDPEHYFGMRTAYARATDTTVAQALRARIEAGTATPSPVRVASAVSPVSLSGGG
jgi:hypothetical protein